MPTDFAGEARRYPVFSQVADDLGEGISQAVSGRPPQKEEGIFQVCARLAKAWSSPHGAWTAEEKDTAYVHCLLRPHSEDIPDMDAQVTRVIPSPGFWKEVAIEGRAETDKSYTELVEAQRSSAARKEAKYPSDQRRNLVLVLDASRFPGAALESVASAARSRHHDFASLGFGQVWVVGPFDGMVFRLDS